MMMKTCTQQKNPFDVTRCEPLVEWDLLAHLEHPSSPPICCGFVWFNLQFLCSILKIIVCPFVLFLLVIALFVREPQSSVFVQYFVDHCLSLCPFSLGHCFICSRSSIFSFCVVFCRSLFVPSSLFLGHCFICPSYNTMGDTSGICQPICSSLIHSRCLVGSCCSVVSLLKIIVCPF